MFLDPDFLKHAKISTIRVHLRHLHGFSGPCLKWGFWGQNIGRVVRYWLISNELVFAFGGSDVSAHFGENRSRNATVRVLADGRNDTLHTVTDANRFSNLSHAICYSYETDKTGATMQLFYYTPRRHIVSYCTAVPSRQTTTLAMSAHTIEPTVLMFAMPCQWHCKCLVLSLFRRNLKKSYSSQICSLYGCCVLFACFKCSV